VVLEPVIERLIARGQDATAIDLPGRAATVERLPTVTLDEWIEAVADAVAAAGVPILVAHSMGGVPCSAFAERYPDAIRGLVYLNALIPRDGQAGLPLLRDEAGPDGALSDANAVLVAKDGTSVTVLPIWRSKRSTGGALRMSPRPPSIVSAPNRWRRS